MKWNERNYIDKLHDNNDDNADNDDDDEDIVDCNLVVNNGSLTECPTHPSSDLSQVIMIIRFHIERMRIIIILIWRVQIWGELGDGLYEMSCRGKDMDRWPFDLMKATMKQSIIIWVIIIVDQMKFHLSTRIRWKWKYIGQKIRIKEYDKSECNENSRCVFWITRGWVWASWLKF